MNASVLVTMWSVQPLSTSMPAVFHWVRAAQYSSSGEANVGPIATESCLPPSLSLMHALSRWPFSSHLLHGALSFLLQSLAKCPGIPHTKQFPFLGHFLKSRFTSSATEPLCPLCLCAVLSCKLSSLFLNSVKFAELKLSCITKHSYFIGRPLRTKALKSVFETASPASCSLVSNSCPRMKKLSKSSASSSCSRASCATKVTTVGFSALWYLSFKSFQAFATSPMPSSPTQSCLISIRVVASRVKSRWRHLLFRFFMMSATSLSYASFSTLWFLFSSLLVQFASGARSLGCSSVPSSDLYSPFACIDAANLGLQIEKSCALPV